MKERRRSHKVTVFIRLLHDNLLLYASSFIASTCIQSECRHACMSVGTLQPSSVELANVFVVLESSSEPMRQGSRSEVPKQWYTLSTIHIASCNSAIFSWSSSANCCRICIVPISIHSHRHLSIAVNKASHL